ncbi:hypothetical protein GBP94_05935 [Mycobacterium avium subsp. hominissuis]|uniref:hypothetical protein n=1 Tax=Mycobacterium avium TaxID=1764 RepID=UPI001CC51CDF|nr:hypothetical protein [Mycobacterium avium]MBZ4514592.1 hypothetical protein [Mycobacterium avium subsp. hominissuis]MBZ4628952.1 hypothetical protein [Mycobacterium avium subsp. hominissuis]
MNTDETNTDLSQSKFFIYGGLIATPEQMKDAHDAVVAIRSTYGFHDSDQFKFHTRSRPSHITIDDWTSAKSEALDALKRLNIVMLAYVVSHSVAKARTDEEKLKWAMNALFSHFGLRFLPHVNSYGVISIDRLPQQYSYDHLESLFTDGVTVDTRRQKLDRVIHYSITSLGASHINSLVDISLGAFRFCVNVASGAGGNEVRATEMLPTLAHIMWKGKDSPQDQLHIRDYGLILYPKEIRAANIKAEYDSLLAKLNELGMPKA